MFGRRNNIENVEENDDISDNKNISPYLKKNTVVDNQKTDKDSEFKELKHDKHKNINFNNLKNDIYSLVVNAIDVKVINDQFFDLKGLKIWKDTAFSSSFFDTFAVITSPDTNVGKILSAQTPTNTPSAKSTVSSPSPAIKVVSRAFGLNTKLSEEAPLLSRWDTLLKFSLLPVT